MKKIVRLLAITLIALSVVGCLPRGETKTLDAVFSDAQSNFKRTNPELVPAAAKSLLDKTEQSIVKLTSSANPSSVTADIATTIRALIPYAGYTSRASFAEIASQLEEASTNKAFDTAAAKLIATRIYSMLSIEISTTHFGVSPL
jgi:hypothetical protein